MQENELDKTRKRIRADLLSEKDRREMMQKLINVGGQTQEGRSSRRQAAGGYRQGPLPEHSGYKKSDSRTELPSDSFRGKPYLKPQRELELRLKKKQEEREAASLLARLKLKFRCLTSGIVDMDNGFIKLQFLSRLKFELQRILMDLYVVRNQLFASNSAIAAKVIQALDAENPLYAELIERAAHLYDQRELNLLFGEGSKPMLLNTVRPALFSLLRKLHYMKAFQESYPNALRRAIAVVNQEKVGNHPLVTIKKRSLIADWEKLMNYFYRQFILLFQVANGRLIKPDGILFNEILEITADGWPGRRSTGTPLQGGFLPQSATKFHPTEQIDESKQRENSHKGAVEQEVLNETINKKTTDNTVFNSSLNEEMEKTKKMEEAGKRENTLTNLQTDEESAPLQKELEYGRQLMHAYTIADLRKKFDSRKLLASINDKDKALISYLFLREFDEEYASILISTHIRFNVTYFAGVKQNYREKIQDIYNSIRKVEVVFKQYPHECQEFSRRISEKHNVSDYIRYSQRLSQIKARRTATSRQIRQQVTEYMENIRKLLAVLIEDMHGRKEIISNYEETIASTPFSNKRGKLQGKTVKESIIEAYSFCNAFLRRLTSGDLQGSLVEIEEEDSQKSFPQTK